MFPSAKLNPAQPWPSIGKIVAEDRLPISGRCPNDNSGMHLAANSGPNSAANTCFRHSNGPMLCRTLVFLLAEWFSVVKVTHRPVMCRPWATLAQ